MAMELKEMAQLDAIQIKIEELIVQVAAVREQLSLAINDHGHLEKAVTELKSRMTSAEREITLIKSEQNRYDQLTRDLRRLEEQLPSQIQQAVSSALQPYQEHMAKQNVWARVAKTAANCGWALLLIVLTALITRWLDDRAEAAAAAKPPATQQTRSP